MERLADELPIEQVAQRWIVASDPEEVVKQFQPYLDAGFNHLVVHGPGHDQERFLTQFTEDVLPLLRKLGWRSDNREMGDYVIVQEGDPRCAELEAAGYRVVAESWALRLQTPTASCWTPPYAVRSPADSSSAKSALSPPRHLHALEKTNESDYPYTPATHRAVGDLTEPRASGRHHRVFGAFDGSRLVGATVIRVRDGFGDTSFTSVLAAHRRRGVGQAVKAASILAFLDLRHQRASAPAAPPPTRPSLQAEPVPRLRPHRTLAHLRALAGDATQRRSSDRDFGGLREEGDGSLDQVFGHAAGGAGDGDRPAGSGVGHRYRDTAHPDLLLAFVDGVAVLAARAAGR